MRKAEKQRLTLNAHAQGNPIQLQHLLKGLKQCDPVSEKLLLRLFERVGCNLN